MRIAVVSDIHGNLTALEAVLNDLRQTAPDAVISGGDLATHGHRPGEVIDRLRELEWRGVRGNTDEMLWAPERFSQVAAAAPKLEPLLEILFNTFAPATRLLIGDDRLKYLRGLPTIWRTDILAVVHATADDLWKAPMPDAPDQVLRDTYGSLGARVAVYGHIHRGFVRSMERLVVANAGSVGLPYDGDTRASYLVVDDAVASVRRVEYDVEDEVRSLLASDYPHRAWLAEILMTGRFIPPPSPASA